jgi:UPF0755 protein
VADGQRTSADREAARRERERRRAERDGIELPAPEPAPPEPAPPEPAPAASELEPSAPEPPAPQEAVVPEELQAEPEFETGEHEPESASGIGEHELEIAAGTRRISHLENIRSRGARESRQPGRPGRPARPARQRTRPGSSSRSHSWRGRIGALIALVVGAVLIWFLVELFQPFGTSPHGNVTVVIPVHSTSSQVGDLLAREGVISSSFFFELRATLAGERGSLRAGTYHLQRDMSYGDVLTKLTTPPPAAKTTELTIVDGHRRSQIAVLLRAQHIKGNYLAATRTTTLLNFRAYGIRGRPPSLEGFLFPDTYQLLDPIRISALVRDQLIRFKQEFSQVNMSYARRKNLSPYDVLKIASLIEAEVPSAHDRPLVASVIYNRLADHMFLGFDSTVSYATGNYSNSLTVTQLHSKSPYNTFTHLGLPPTPINNPGLAAIQAAAHPAQTNYLYFFSTRCKANSVFASSYAQFLAQGRYYASKHC